MKQRGPWHRHPLLVALIAAAIAGAVSIAIAQLQINSSERNLLASIDAGREQTRQAGYAQFHEAVSRFMEFPRFGGQGLIRR